MPRYTDTTNTGRDKRIIRQLVRQPEPHARIKNSQVFHLVGFNRRDRLNRVVEREKDRSFAGIVVES